MIASLTGTLSQVDDTRVHLTAGPIVYELLIPAADHPALAASIGETVTFHTIFYLSGDPSRGGLDPTLIGFLRPQDKKFFELFTTVKGIGPKRALRALTVPTGEIAAAIEAKETRFLIGLPEIGKRTAETIIAELAGKVAPFALAAEIGARAAGVAKPPASRRSAIEEDAIAGLMSLGDRRPDAEVWLDRAKAARPEATTTDALLREMLRLRTGR